MASTLVRDLMTTEVATLEEHRDFISAKEIMELKHVRHVPVVAGKRLVGLVTHRDLMRAQAKLLEALSGVASGGPGLARVRVGDIMSEVLLTCRPNTEADDAARMMLDARIGCMLVVEDDELVGILTETDVMSWAVELMAKHRFDSTPPPGRPR